MEGVKELKIEIKLDWPDASLMPNRKNGRHWGGTQGAKVRARQEGYFATKQAMAGRVFAIDGSVPLRVTFVSPDKRDRDLDNLLASLKHGLDGIAKALGVNDAAFRPITIDSTVDQFKRGFVLVEVGHG